MQCGARQPALRGHLSGNRATKFTARNNMPDINIASSSQPSRLAAALNALRAKLHGAQLPGHEISVAEALTCRDMQLEYDALQVLSPDLPAIEALIRDDDRFPTQEVSMASIHGCAGIFPYAADRSLVVRALKTSGEEAIAWYLKVLATSSASGMYIHALWGVDATSRIQLAADLAVVPVSELPESWQRESLKLRPLYWGLASMSGFAWMNPPTMALVASHVLDPLILVQPATLNMDATTRLIQKVDDAALCLTAIGPRAPLLAMAWWEFDDADIRDADRMRSGSFGQAIEIVPRMGQTFPMLDASLAMEIVGAFQRLQPTSQARVRLALQRLGQALRRHGLGDKAIELAIALETLTADDGSNEVSHKVKVRATKLLGGDGAARERNAKLIAETYNIRSKQMHTGSFDASKSKAVAGASLTPAEILEQTAALCANLIVAMIRRGSIPAWNTFDIDAEA